MNAKENISYIKETVVRENKPQFASDISERYKQIYRVKGGCKEDVDSYSNQHLTSKLKSALDKEVLIKADGKKRKIIWKNSSMPINQASQIAKKNHGEDKTTIWKCATILRDEILSLKSSPLNEGWSAENIIKGEVDIPENLQNFYKILYTGSESGPCSSRKNCFTNFSSANAIFVCPGGKPIPGKHL